MCPIFTLSRKALAACLGACLGFLSAQEPASLLLPYDTGTGGTAVIVAIDPILGTATVLWSKNIKGPDSLEVRNSASFLSELTRLRNLQHYVANPLADTDKEQPSEIGYPFLQLGKNTTPAYGDLFDGKNPRACWFNTTAATATGFEKTSTTKPKAGEKPADSEFITAFKTEREFWSKPVENDGVVHGAISGQYCALYIPKHFAFMVYRIVNDDLELYAYRNIRPEMMLRISDRAPFFSMPHFNDIKAQLVNPGSKAETLLAVRKQAIDDAMKKMQDAALIPVMDSDAFLTALPGQNFALLDMNNNRLMLYRVGKGLELVSHRNLEFDRLLPIWPLPKDDIDAQAKYQTYLYTSQLRQKRQDAEMKDIVQKLLSWVGSEAKFKYLAVDEKDAQLAILRNIPALSDKDVGGKAGKKSFEATTLTSGNSLRLMIDIKSMRKMLTYDLAGSGGKIELVGIHEYNLKDGMSLYTDRLKNAITARDFFENTIRPVFSQSNAGNWCVHMLEYLLKMAPAYLKVVEKDPGLATLKKNLEKVDKKAGNTEWRDRLEKLLKDSAPLAETATKWPNRLLELVQEELKKKEESLVLLKEGKRPEPPK